jgi:hypothetical protein
MDDFNQRMADARRQAARELQLRVDREQQAKAQSATDTPRERDEAPAGQGRLVLRRTQGEFRYTLAEERVRSGDVLEFYVGPGSGWLRGVFQWGRRNTSSPSLLVRVVHPDDPSAFLGDMEVILPDEAVLRWPGVGDPGPAGAP